MSWLDLGAIAVAAYLIECVLFPYRRCWPCRGSGRIGSPASRSWRTCRCGGDGRAIRWGRRAFEAVRRGLS